MLRKTKVLQGCRLGAREGEIGHIKDVYFDDQTWTVRYLVADTGDWLPHLKVLISPMAVTGLQLEPHRVVAVNLTRDQIEHSPPIGEHNPVSRQFEARYSQYFGWPYYWSGPSLWGAADFPGPMLPMPLPDTGMANSNASQEDLHLRSVNEVAGFNGYLIQALDLAFGHIEEFIWDDQNWAIRYLVADTRKWWPGKHVLLSPQWISWVSWSEARVYVDLDAETIRRSPVYDPAVPLTRRYEEALFEHYSRPPYWQPNRQDKVNS